MMLTPVSPLLCSAAFDTQSVALLVKTDVGRRKGVESCLTDSHAAVVPVVLFSRGYGFEVIWPDAMLVGALRPDVVNGEPIGNGSDPEFVGVPMGSYTPRFPIHFESELSVSVVLGTPSPEPASISLVDLTDKKLITSQSMDGHAPKHTVGGDYL